MKIEIHRNSDVERKENLILLEEKNQVQTVKGRTISNFTEEVKKDGRIKRSFVIKESNGRKIQFTWTVSCPLVAIVSNEKEDELLGFAFIVDETYKHKPVSLEFWTMGCDSCDAYCLDCIRG